jgi:hypothetical protein
LRLCCLSRFSCAFYLTNIYCKVVCCCPIFVLTFFFISTCIGQSRSLPRSLTARLATLFLSPSLFILFRVDVNTRRTLPLVLNHSLFTCPASALF